VRVKYIEQTNNADNEKTMKSITEMVKSLGDKYTRVLDVQQYTAIQKFDLIGVGVTLMPNSQKEIIVGAPPIEASPSAKAGLKTGDFVTAVNGFPTKGHSAFDIIDQISENPDAKTVTFTIRRQGENDFPGEGPTFEATMERQNFQVQDPVQYKISEQRSDGTKVGYIRVSEFNSLVNSKLQQALVDLNQQGANAYVLDLRGNTGGAFQSAVEVSGFFFQDRVATYVVDSNDVELPFRVPKGKLAVDPKAPLVVWIDGMSASASEVLAGSLHDNCRAVTMGDKSFGKGLIQAVYGLKNGAGLVMTVARYVTPSGNEIQGVGITPDIAGSMPAPVIIPILSSDTSKVNFQEISKRLDPSFCKVPEEHASTKSREAVSQ
jgi:carboxyl-terminal processing protease